MSTGGFICPVDTGHCACGASFPWNRVARMMRGVHRHRCDACGRRMVIDYHNGYGVRLEITPAQWTAVKQLPDDTPLAEILELLKTIEAA